ncbi:hypothetical protein TNIN_448031 [Trichonephila inaurata madagascariensis]|uniref:Histone H2A/H2B/H3 domain-containing protein n=1 Tax=Trichonephila inaurata madagascariensis TaxID=2747483 RepID=A0A8X6YEQ4_9ARAC|nr:hypothetical protein TNIN_448031 [Trichonephila inaurata madagascariensis]
MSQKNKCEQKHYYSSLKRSSHQFQNLVRLTSNRKSRRHRQLLRKSFKRFVLKVKGLVAPKMKLGSLTLTELDDFIAHMISLLETELGILYRSNPKKTLSLRQVESAVKACLPTFLADSSIEFGRLAVSSYSERIFR